MQRVIQQDIADRLGVSKMTVSRALRDDPAISAATRERVRQAANEMGYTPNPLVAALMSNLRRGRTPPVGPRTVALIHGHGDPGAWEHHPPTSALLAYHRGAVRAAAGLGFKAESFAVEPTPPETISRALQILRARGVRAVAFLPLGTEIRLTPEELATFALNDVGFSLPDPDLNRTAPDHFQNARRAVIEGLARGRRRIGIIIPTAIARPIRDRWIGGYLAALHDGPPGCGLPVVEVADGPIPQNGPLRIWRGKCRPDWVIHTGNWAYDAVREAGMIAERICCDLNMHADSKAHRGIDQRHEEVGVEAVHVLVQQLNAARFGVPRIPRITLLAGRWTESAADMDPQ